MRRLLAVSLTAAALAGCAVGPKYSRPPVPAPDRYYGMRAPAGEASLVNSYDVRIAAARVEEAERGRAVSATREAVRLSTMRYESGFSAYFEVLDALQQALVSETVLVATRRNRLVELSSFYKALGGGWDPSATGSPTPAR